MDNIINPRIDEYMRGLQARYDEPVLLEMERSSRGPSHRPPVAAPPSPSPQATASIRRARAALTRIAGFFSHLRKTAEQLTALERWYRILSEALKKFLRGRKLVPPRQLPAGAASYS
jgi:hypothetical protein